MEAEAPAGSILAGSLSLLVAARMKKSQSPAQRKPHIALGNRLIPLFATHCLQRDPTELQPAVSSSSDLRKHCHPCCFGAAMPPTTKVLEPRVAHTGRSNPHRCRQRSRHHHPPPTAPTAQRIKRHAHSKAVGERSMTRSLGSRLASALERLTRFLGACGTDDRRLRIATSQKSTRTCTVDSPTNPSQRLHDR